MVLGVKTWYEARGGNYLMRSDRIGLAYIKDAKTISEEARDSFNKGGALPQNGEKMPGIGRIGAQGTIKICRDRISKIPQGWCYFTGILSQR